MTANNESSPIPESDESSDFFSPISASFFLPKSLDTSWIGARMSPICSFEDDDDESTPRRTSLLPHDRFQANEDSPLLVSAKHNKIHPLWRGGGGDTPKRSNRKKTQQQKNLQYLLYAEVGLILSTVLLFYLFIDLSDQWYYSILPLLSVSNLWEWLWIVLSWILLVRFPSNRYLEFGFGSGMAGTLVCLAFDSAKRPTFSLPTAGILTGSGYRQSRPLLFGLAIGLQVLNFPSLICGVTAAAFWGWAWAIASRNNGNYLVWGARIVCMTLIVAPVVTIGLSY